MVQTHQDQGGRKTTTTIAPKGTIYGPNPSSTNSQPAATPTPAQEPATASAQSHILTYTGHTPAATISGKFSHVQPISWDEEVAAEAHKPASSADDIDPDAEEELSRAYGGIMLSDDEYETDE